VPVPVRHVVFPNDLSHFFCPQRMRSDNDCLALTARRARRLARAWRTDHSVACNEPLELGVAIALADRGTFALGRASMRMQPVAACP
jgi:hypothetical protein